jgi:hypothetical protein
MSKRPQPTKDAQSQKRSRARSPPLHLHSNILDELLGFDEHRSIGIPSANLGATGLVANQVGFDAFLQTNNSRSARLQHLFVRHPVAMARLLVFLLRLRPLLAAPPAMAPAR